MMNERVVDKKGLLKLDVSTKSIDIDNTNGKSFLKGFLSHIQIYLISFISIGDLC